MNSVLPETAQPLSPNRRFAIRVRRSIAFVCFFAAFCAPGITRAQIPSADPLYDQFRQIAESIDSSAYLGELSTGYPLLDYLLRSSPPTPSNVKVDKSLGLSAKGDKLYLEVTNRNALNPHEKLASRSIWEIDLDTGRLVILADGNVVESFLRCMVEEVEKKFVE